MANLTEIINSSPLVLVDFFAEWCGPCKTLAPILEEVKKELGDQIRIIKIDVDKHNQLASQMNVRGVPSLFFYKEGQLIKSTSGVLTSFEIRKIFS